MTRLANRRPGTPTAAEPSTLALYDVAGRFHVVTLVPTGVGEWEAYEGEGAESPWLGSIYAYTNDTTDAAEYAARRPWEFAELDGYVHLLEALRLLLL